MTQKKVDAVQVMIFAADVIGDKPERRELPVDKQKDQYYVSPSNLKVYVETFRVSASTKLELIKRRACEFWGLIERDFTLFKTTFQADPESLANEMNSVVHKVAESLLAGPKNDSSEKNKRRDNQGNLVCQFYLGRMEQAVPQKSLKRRQSLSDFPQEPNFADLSFT